MPKKNISTLSPVAIGLTVLSKLLYAVMEESEASNIIKEYHRQILKETTEGYDFYASCSSENSFSLDDIPWVQLLDKIIGHKAGLKEICATHSFTQQELRYMAAMACGLTGKEFGLITGFKSHYNLSWAIRHKLGLPERTSNLRLLLQVGYLRLRHESSESVAPK
ncbi:MAG: hypothetical protein NC453_18290 [Muribaculum sp.]|nr:hypothetical protein [Muribaculum sp.]